MPRNCRQNGGSLFQQRIGSLCQLVSLFRLGAIVEQADTRLWKTVHTHHVRGAHERKLLQIRGLTIGVCTAVEQQYVATVDRWQQRRQRRTLDARNAADNQRRRGQ